MYCGLRIRTLKCIKRTSGEGGDRDEVYFKVIGGSMTHPISREVRPSDPNHWSMWVGRTVPNIMLWQGFIAVGEVATLRVEIWEEDTFRDDLIGIFFVLIPNVPPGFVTVTWSTLTQLTSNTGVALGDATTISAKESGADYELDLAIERARTITSVNSNKCLDVAGGSLANNANVQQFGCHGGPNQGWYIQFRDLRYPKTSPPFPPLRNGDLDRLYRAFYLFADHSGLCLDVALDGVNTNVQQFRLNGGSNQTWFLVPTGTPGEFYIDSDFSGNVLDVAAGSVNDNANVQVFPFHSGPNQRWRIQPPPFLDSFS